MNQERIKHIPESKKQTVAELKDLIKNNKTILVASIKNIPASQFQEIAKKLRGKAVVRVPKKNLIYRAFDSSENEEVKKLKDQIKNSVAILFSELDSFELAAELLQKKSPAKAKAGQEAPEDIVVEEGLTDLVPGPAISELGALGIQIQIEKGKISIKSQKIIVKKGEKISANAADVMNKLNLKPFSVGFIPLSSFDTKEGKLYLEIKIDREESLRELKSFYGKSLAFAIEIGYFSEGTIKFMIAKAGICEMALENLTEEKKKPDTEGVKESKDNRKTPDSLSDNIKNKRDKPLVSADSEITESEQSKKSEPSREANTQQDKSKEENK